jgi:beta-galactosidase GanA
MIDEVRETAKGFKDAAEFLNGTKPSSPGFAVHFSTLAWTQLRFQPLVQEFDYIDAMLNRIYRPLMDVHLRADVIDPAASLDGYRLIFSPFLPALDESGLRERLYRWIEAGGTWVVGPFTDVRDVHGTKPTNAPFVCLEEWAGVFCKYEVPADPRELALRYVDGTVSQGSLWYSGFECRDAKSLAVYTEGPLEGLSAVTETRVGEGSIILLGTLPSAKDLQRLMLQAAAQCDIQAAAEATSNVLVVPREGDAGEGLIVVELENRPGRLALPAPAHNLLDRKQYAGTVEISPYQVLVLSTTEEFREGSTSEHGKRTTGREMPQPAGR